jgi:hypothetical protein
MPRFEGLVLKRKSTFLLLSSFSLFPSYVSLLLVFIACFPSPVFLPGVFIRFVFLPKFLLVSLFPLFFILSFLLTFSFFPKLLASLLSLMHHLSILSYFYPFSFPLVFSSFSIFWVSALISQPLPLPLLHSFLTFLLMAYGYIHIKPTTVMTAIKTIFSVLGRIICVYRRPLRRCGIARNTLCSFVCLWR